MKIVVFCEGATEVALRSGLHTFLNRRIGSAGRVAIQTKMLRGAVSRPKLASLITNEAREGDLAGVVALTDVYPRYRTAAEAKADLFRLAGETARSIRFTAHAAQFEVEAWLLPFWDEIKGHLRGNAAKPRARPEAVNNQNPPSTHLKTLYASAGRKYQKAIDGPKWLTAERLESAAAECPELKLFLSSILCFAGAEPLP